MVHKHPHLALQHFRFMKNLKLVELYMTIALTVLSFSLVGLFIPLYLIVEIGYSFQDVMVFLIVSFVAMAFSFLLGLKISSKWGMNKSFLISVPFRIAFLLLLNALNTYSIPLLFIALVSGLGAGTFWFPYHKRFAQCSDHKRRGSELGIRYAIGSLFAILGPILGALIATHLGFNVLYIVASIILAVSILPMLFMKEEKVKDDLKLRDIIKGKSYKTFLGHFAEGFRVEAYVIWAIYLFFALGSYLSLGAISSGIAFLNGILHIFTGYLSDIFDKKVLLRFGLFVDALSWFFRLFFHSIYSFFAVTAVGSLAIVTWYMPFASKFYDNMSHKKDGTSHILFREFALTFGRVSLFLVAFLFGLKFTIVATGFILFLILLF